MPTFPERVASYVAGAASRVESIARRIAGPEQSRVANIPGAPTYNGPRPDSRTLDLLRSWGVYESRVSPLAGPTRDRWALWNADDLTPSAIVDAQRSAVSSGIPYQWIELIDHVFSRDIDYASVTNQRVADVMRGQWTFRRNGNDDAAGIALAFAQEAQRGCSRWRDGLGWLLYSNLYCYNAIEVEWTIDRIVIPGPSFAGGGKGRPIGPVEVAVPKRLHNTLAKHFRFDLQTDDPLFWIVDGYQPLPLGKFVFMEGDGLHPIKVRHGHAWQAIWFSMFTTMSIGSWAVFVDRFGMPVPKIEYDADIAVFDEQKAAIDAVLNALGSGKGVKFPRGQFDLSFVEPAQGGRSNDPHSAFWDACKTAKVVRVLGAELANATGNVGSYAAKSQDIATKYNLEDWDAARLSERVTEQLTAPLIWFNAEAIAAAANRAGYNVTPDQLCRRVPFGKQSVPREMTPQVRASVLKELVSVGMPISMQAEFDELPFSRAINDEDRIPGEAQVVGKGAALATPKEAADAPVVNPDPAAEAKAAEVAQGKPEETPPPRTSPEAKPEPTKPPSAEE